MRIQFTGRHVGLTAEDREHAIQRIEALTRFNDHLGDVEIRVGLDGAILERVEIDVGLGHHHRAVAVAEAPDFRRAFDDAVKGLRRQIQKDKGKAESRRRRSGVARNTGGGRKQP